MIILGFLVWLPINVILAISEIIICLNNLQDYFETKMQGQVGLLWECAHLANIKEIKLLPNHIALVVYAFLPWTGIMLIG